MPLQVLMFTDDILSLQLVTSPARSGESFIWNQILYKLMSAAVINATLLYQFVILPLKVDCLAFYL